MTTASHADFSLNRFKPIAMTHSPTGWAADIASFDKLIETARKISAMQTVLMEYIRETTEFLKRETDQASAVQKDVAFKETLGSFAAACPSSSGSVKALQIKASYKSLEAAKHKLAEADAKLKQVQDRTRILERKILTHEPDNHEEAIDMIQFLSRLFKAHGKVEDEYLSHVLEACATAADCPPNTAATQPYQQLAAA